MLIIGGGGMKAVKTQYVIPIIVRQESLDVLYLNFWYNRSSVIL